MVYGTTDHRPQTTDHPIVKEFRLKKLLHNLDLVIAGAALLVLIFVTFAAVIMRYVVSKPIIWGEEVQIMCIIFVVMFAAGAAFRTGNHVAIDLVVDRLHPKAARIVEWIVFIFSIIILLYFAWQGYKYARQMWQIKRTTEILDVPYWLIYGTFPLGCLMMIYNYSIVTLTRFGIIKTKEAAQ
jgi:TRAP-type C4-dicarboxylate transport system permease small subunit